MADVKEKFQNEWAVLIVDETGFLKQEKCQLEYRDNTAGTAGRIKTAR